MRDGLVDLPGEIKSKRHAVEKARQRVEALKIDLKREEGSLADLELDLATLERALSITRRKARKGSAEILAQAHSEHASGKPPSGNPFAIQSIAVVAETILREAGRAMTINELYPLLSERRKQSGSSDVSKDAMSGVLYRKAKKQKVFKYVGPGTIGLLN